MTAQEFLNRIVIAERNLEVARDREERYRCSMQRITASFGGEHVSHTRNVSSQEDAIIRYMEAVEISNRLETEKNAVIDEVEEMISKLDNDDYRVLLRRVYIKHESIEDIAKSQFLDPKYAYRKRKRALGALEILLNETGH